jgi:hypothetical protein
MAVERIFDRCGDRVEIRPFLEEAVVKLHKYHRFLLTERDPYGRGLAAIFHPWASGTDNSPCYDSLIERSRGFLTTHGYEQAIVKRKDIDNVIAAYRPGEKDYDCYGRLISFYRKNNYDQQYIYENCPFVVEDAMFNSILADSLKAVAKVAGFLGKDFEREAQESREWNTKVVAGIKKYLWDKESGFFYNYDVRGKELLRGAKTIHGFGPMLTGGLDEEKDQIMETFRRDFKREGAIGVPTTAFTDANFEPLRYWRGPVWPVTNWLVALGFEKSGFIEEAKELRDGTVRVIAERETGDLRERAARLMEYMSYGEEFTTPSKQQYCHGWLWDSGFAAIGWTRVEEKLDGLSTPLFGEYYCPVDFEGHRAGEPIGAPMMTWTAAIFLDLTYRE